MIGENKCPLCRNEIISDATLPGYCKLCGIGTNSIDFCCEICKEKFQRLIPGGIA